MRLHVRTAMTRKNYVFAGSDGGAERAAIAYTIRAVHRTLTRVIADGQVRTAAGTGARGCDDGPSLAATFGLVTDVATGPDGRLYIADPTNHVVRVFTP